MDNRQISQQNNDDIINSLQQELIDNMAEYRGDIRSGKMVAEIRKAQKRRWSNNDYKAGIRLSPRDIILCLTIVGVMVFAVWFNMSHTRKIQSNSFGTRHSSIQESYSNNELRELVDNNAIFKIIEGTVGVDVGAGLDAYLDAVDQMKDISSTSITSTPDTDANYSEQSNLD